MEASITNAIETTNLFYCYPEGQQVLNGIDLIVPIGQSVGLIGGNGSGKTTLLMLVSGELTGYGNLIEVMGDSITGKKSKWFFENIRLVHENPEDHFKRKTVYYNIALGPKAMGLPKSEIEKKVAELLTLVDGTNLAKRKHEHLSIGEKKRLSIATALSTDPHVLLLDEPTISLDPRNTKAMIKLLAGLEMTKVIATHDLELVKAVCDRTIVLYAGKAIADGPTADIMSNTALLDSYGLLPKDSSFEKKEVRSLLDLDL